MIFTATYMICDVCMQNVGHVFKLEREAIQEFMDNGWRVRDGTDICPRCIQLEKEKRNAS